MDARRLVTGAAEIRAAEDGGRRLYGTAIQEGRAAGDRGEVFAPGSITWPAEGMGVTLAHRAAPEVRATTTRQGNGEITIEARATPRMVEAYEAGRRALSIEFHSLAEERKGGNVREITSAFVPLVAMVPVGAYNEASAEVRRRIGGVSAGFRTGKALDCRCGPQDCATATIELDGLTIPDDTPGFLGDFKRPLGAVSATVKGDRVTVNAEIRDTSWGRDLLEAGEDALIVRPYPDARRSEWEKRGRDRYFQRLYVAAWIFAWTDQTGGHDKARLEGRQRIWL